MNKCDKISSDDSKLIKSRLFKWQKTHFRTFEWRFTSDPYRIMIAEFMLHRTKAEQAATIYSNFLDKYPDVNSLANADLNEVSGLIHHLGLHWRASHFIEACKFINREYNGIYPQDREELLRIPGIGEYVAGAILTVCFKKPEYVIDSNVARLINRYYGLHLSGEIRRKKVIIEKAKELFKCETPDKLLFSILDFTALVCKPRNPDCLNCCLNEECAFSKEECNNTP